MCYVVLNEIRKINEVRIYINSIGGNIFEGLIAYDVNQFSKFDIRTICLKQASSLSSLMLASGTIGKRLCLKHASLFVHQPNVTIVNGLSTLMNGLVNINYIGENIIKIYIRHCDKNYFEVIRILLDSI